MPADQRVDDGAGHVRLGMPTRGAIARGGALVLAGMIVVLAIVGLLNPPAVAVRRPVVVGLAIPLFLLHVGVAAAPWSRWASRPTASWLLATTVLAEQAAVILALAHAVRFSPVLLSLALVPLLYSAAVLRAPAHAAVTVVSLMALLTVLAVDGWPLEPSDAVTYAMIFVVTAGFSRYAFGLAERASALATEHRQRSERYAAMLSAVARASRAMSTPEVRRILETVVDTTEAFDADTAAIYVRSAEAGACVHAVSRGLPPEARTWRFPGNPGLAAEVLRQERTIAVRDYVMYPHANADLIAMGIQSALGTPIIANGEVAGILVIGSLRTRTYGPRDLEVLELLAAQAGRALELASRFDEQERSIDELRELDAVKHDFLATVSHELRNPVTIVAGISDTLDDHWHQLDEPGRRDLVVRLRANAAALRSVVSRLLDLARLERGTIELTPATFDLADLARRTAERLAPALDGHVLDVDAPMATPVRADRELIERVIENLLVNACTHTPPGTRVSLRVESGATRGHLRVDDEGPGLAPARTEPPPQGEDGLGEAAGLGLGLSLCRRLLALHDSDLEIRSEPGTGASVGFALPLSPAAPRS